MTLTARVLRFEGVCRRGVQGLFEVVNFTKGTIMAGKIYRLLVDAETSGIRIDQFVAARVPELSRGQVRKIIDLGGVHLAGRRVGRCSLEVRCGQKVEVYLDGRSLEVFSLSPDQILFQDAYLLVIDKPAGVEFQPTHARYKGTLYDAVRRYLAESESSGVTLGMVQRLDRDTSGATVFSIHPRAHGAMTKLFSERRVEKRYRALVCGSPEEDCGEIRSLLARQHRTNRMKSVDKGGKEAITRYRVLERFDSYALVEVELVTGRSHQIRAHFCEAGHALLGDRSYGGDGSSTDCEAPRTMLHAFGLAFTHPVSGLPLVFEVAPPADMLAVLNGLRDHNNPWSLQTPKE